MRKFVYSFMICIQRTEPKLGQRDLHAHAFRNCRLSELGKESPLLLPHSIKQELDKIAEEKTAPELLKGSAYEVLLTAQEMIVRKQQVAIALRPDIGWWKYVIVDTSSMKIQGLETAAYLEFKEKLSPQRMLNATACIQVICILLSSAGLAMLLLVVGRLHPS